MMTKKKAGAPAIELSNDFEASKAAVVAAMVYPDSAERRAAYCLRLRWRLRLQHAETVDVPAADLQLLLDAPSRNELDRAGAEGSKRGFVAGDLLGLMYEQWRMGQPEPSLRSALRRYREWAVGQSYGDGEALKYSDAQLRKYFEIAAPSAHLWAAFRLSPHLRRTKRAFTRDGLPELLGVAMAIQTFATTFVPKRTKPPKPVIAPEVILAIPTHIEQIELQFRVL
jgi:hypothetical protein